MGAIRIWKKPFEWYLMVLQKAFRAQKRHPERGRLPDLFQAQKLLILSILPSNLHVIALDQLKCDFSKMGHLWGIFHHSGE